MNYVVWSTKTGELVAFGTAQRCAEIMTDADMEEFKRIVSACMRGCDEGYEIHTVSTGGIFACPCDDCVKGHRHSEMVSASCDNGTCERWARWFRRYWHRLRQKYGRNLG